MNKKERILYQKRKKKKRTLLSVTGTQVQSLVQENPIC